MKQHDQVFRFLIQNTAVRGQLISLDASWQKCRERSDASAYAKTLLGHALSAVALLASTLKMKGQLTLQIRGQGPVHLLVAQATSQRSVRGLVRQSKPIEHSQQTLQQIFTSDKIVITIDSGKGHRHQGIVPLTGSSLADALQTYFEQSEQLPTRLWLACNETSASGLLLQKMPGQNEDLDSWNRLTQLASTITDDELLELDASAILHRLFHQETVRMFESEPLRFDCSCSRERSLGMIKSLGKAEAMDIIQEQGKINISCEFCNAQYDFDLIDIEQLFASDDSIASSPTQH